MVVSHAWTSLKRDDGGFKRSAHSAVPNWMFGGFERLNSSENRAKIEFGGQMEDQVGPKMATRTENAGHYDPKLAPTGPKLAPSWPQVGSLAILGST